MKFDANAAEVNLDLGFEIHSATSTNLMLDEARIQ